jgi:transmembrane sensor
MSSLSRLGVRLRAEQDRWLSHNPAWRVARRELRQKLSASPASLEPTAPAGQVFPRQSFPRQVVWALAAVPVALGIGLALRAVSVPESELVSVTVGDAVYKRGDPIFAPSNTSVPLSFSDGSSVVLAPGSRATVSELSRHGAELTLATGSASVHVVHRDQTRWLVNAGPFRVRVTGTRFEVGWDPKSDEFRLVMAEGSVTVSGCGFGDAGPRLSGTEAISAHCNTEAAQRGTDAVASAPRVVVVPEAALKDAPLEPPPLEPTAPRRAAETRAPARVASSAEWLKLAQRGDYATAYTLLDPIFDAQLVSRGAAELGLMADVARLSGHWDRAALAYNTLRARYPDTGRAANAAFSLARLAFDQRKSYAEAARWFQAYLDEEPQGPFAREALGRRVEALDRAGDSAAARREGEQYLKLYPEGPHARAVRGLLYRH